MIFLSKPRTPPRWHFSSPVLSWGTRALREALGGRVAILDHSQPHEDQQEQNLGTNVDCEFFVDWVCVVPVPWLGLGIGGITFKVVPWSYK